MAAEKKLQNKIIDYLKHLKKSGEPILFEKRQAGGFNYEKGKPDLWVAVNGVHIEFELKQPNGKRTPFQIKWEKIIRSTNSLYYCINNYNDFVIIINSILRTAKENE